MGAFLFGILFGVVASPCSTPILAAIATIAAARGSVPQGALLLFVYGLGKGVPLLLLGLAAGSLPAMRSISRATGVLTKIGGAALDRRCRLPRLDCLILGGEVPWMR